MGGRAGWFNSTGTAGHLVLVAPMHSDPKDLETKLPTGLPLPGDGEASPDVCLAVRPGNPQNLPVLEGPTFGSLCGWGLEFSSQLSALRGNRRIHQVGFCWQPRPPLSDPLVGQQGLKGRFAILPGCGATFPAAGLAWGIPALRPARGQAGGAAWPSPASGSASGRVRVGLHFPSAGPGVWAVTEPAMQDRINGFVWSPQLRDAGALSRSLILGKCLMHHLVTSCSPD